MRSMVNMDTVQIEITNACVHRCANCTRFVGRVTPYFMPFNEFKVALDSMVDYPRMTGIMGGEPLLHPEFEKICEYAASKIPRKQLGLWSCFPDGYEKYNEVICKTFGNIFLNDHTRGDIYHHPFLVGIREVVRDKKRMFAIIDNCYFQMSWSASINPHGAFFCEIAASMSLLFRGTNWGWKIEPEWWWRTPKDFGPQIEKWCPKCGGALYFKRRSSQDKLDDISTLNQGELCFKQGTYKIHDLQTVPVDKQEPLALYKDQVYRDRIAARYGIFLTQTNHDCFYNGFFNEPHLFKAKKLINHKPLMEQYKEIYGNAWK